MLVEQSEDSLTLEKNKEGPEERHHPKVTVGRPARLPPVTPVADRDASKHVAWLISEGYAVI